MAPYVWTQNSRRPYYDGLFQAFILYFFLAPENNARNEKKILAKPPQRIKHLGVATGDQDDFTSTFIVFFCYHYIALFLLGTSNKCVK